MATDSHDVGPRYRQRSRVEPDHERWQSVRCGWMAPPGCSPGMDRGERCRIDMEPARAPGDCHDRQKSSYHVSQRCVDVLQAGDVMTREKAPARLVDQRKCEWILSKPNALSGAFAGLRGDDLTAREGARRRSSSSKACRPRLVRYQVRGRDRRWVLERVETMSGIAPAVLRFLLVMPRFVFGGYHPSSWP